MYKISGPSRCNIVAPFVGAWIEIFNVSSTSINFLSLPSWERGLKYVLKTEQRQRKRVAPFVGAWIEMACEPFITAAPAVAPFVGAWIEILLIISCYNQIIVAPFVGAWIEIDAIPCRHHFPNQSLPSWERGLKFCYVLNHSHKSKVAPFVGAWIEISFTSSVPFTPSVAPFVGAWIEINWKCACHPVLGRRSLRGSVD